MPRLVLLLVLGLTSACAAASPAASPAPAAAAAAWSCALPAEPHLRSTLFFGLLRPGGALVSEAEWQGFLREQVTPRFPHGLSVWRVEGQWQWADGRIAEEPSKVLLLLHPDTRENHAAIDTIRVRYKEAFAQESVMWETAPVCVAF